jgi:pilus assembly protein Flp/PilA
MLALNTYLAWHLAGLRDRLRRQRGQGMVEYGLILVLVSLVVVAALLLVGQQINSVFNNIITQLKTA